MTPNNLVKEFHEVMGLPVREKPELPSDEERMLRVNLMEEEHDEYMDAEGYTFLSSEGYIPILEGNDIEEIALELADIVYIVYGTALTYGIPLDEVIQEKHRSNMSKLDDDGKPILREDGKILKGPNFSPPDIGGILYDNSTL